jgi:hypothetical protein
MNFPDRDGFLEIPAILQNQRMLFRNVFVANDIPRVGGGDQQALFPDARDQPDILPLQRGHFHCVLIRHFVVFTVGGNAPRMDAGDFFNEGVERDYHRAVIAPFRPQDFVSYPDHGSELIGGDDGEIVLGVQQYGVGLRIMSG